jgi:hypothetical protein
MLPVLQVLLHRERSFLALAHFLRGGRNRLQRPSQKRLKGK